MDNPQRERDQYKNDTEREVPASQQNNTGKETEREMCQPFLHCLSSLSSEVCLSRICLLISFNVYIWDRKSQYFFCVCNLVLYINLPSFFVLYWLFVFRIILRTDGQSCQALIRACAWDSLCFLTAHALLAYVRTDKQNYNVDYE